MALTITGTLIIDETSGTQNATAGGSDSTGNDVAAGLGFLNTGVSAFDTLLAAVVTQDLTGINVTVSVSNGTSADPDGSSMLSGFGTDVTDLAFTNSTGGSLLGEEALSAPGVSLLTVDGTKIFLYSYTGADLGIDENNVVFGRKGLWNGSEYVADPSGDVVFAAYLQPTDASGVVQTSDLNAVGSKVWLVQYEEIKHPITTNPDDALSLYNLHVTVSNRSDFSLQGAPSGQHLFLMYGDGTPSATDAVIIVTGKNPINQSSDPTAITSGDTVNTGKGGGPTTLGTNSQQIVEGTGLYFTFAKGANTNFTVPNLSQNEAGVEENIDFTSLYGSNGASFSVVQSASGDQSTLEISAYTTPFMPGVDFIDNLHNNEAVAVTKVTITTQPSGHGKNAVAGETLVFDKGVIGTTATTLSGLTVTFSANTVVIKGLEADDLIAYNTNGEHTRVLIDNIGSTDTNFDAPFDIGGFALVNSNVTPNRFSELTFQDDGPSVTVSATNEAAVLLTTQDAQTDGDPTDSDSAATTADFSGVFTNTPVYGADGAGTTTMSYVLSLAGAPGGFSGLNSNGVQINLFDDDGVIKGSTAATLVGVNAANTIFSISVVASTGVVTLTQFAEIDHALENPTGSPFDDQFAVLGAGLVNLTGTALTTDGDGDTATDPETIDLGGNVRFADDGPSVTVSATNEAAVLLTTQDAETIGAASDSAATTADFSGVFTNTPVYGADGAGTTAMSYVLSLAGAPGGFSGLNSNGVQINLFDDGGVIKGSTAATLAGVNAANTIFSIAVVASTGVVTLTQFAQIDHPIAGDPSPTGSPFEDHLAVLGAGLVNLTGTALTTDGDGDTATDPEVIDLGGNVRFADDGPAPLAPADITVANAAGATADAALGYIGKVGADVDGTVKFVGTNGSVLQGMVQDGTPVLENLKIGNLNIYLFGFGTATLTATTDVNNLDASAKVFQMTLNPDGSVAANDLYDITMFQQIENVQVVNFGEIVGVKAGNTDFYLVHNIGGSTVDGLFSAYLNGTPQTVNISTTGVGVANQSIGLGERLQMEFLIDEPSGNPPVSDHLITPAEVESVNHFAFTVTQNNAPADKGDALIRVYAANGDEIQIQEILINGVNVLLAPVLSNEQPNKPSAPRNYVTAVADGLGYKLYGLGGGIGGGNGSDNDTVEIITNTDYARIDIEGIADTDPNTADNDTFDILLLSLAITTPYDLSFAVQANLTDEDGDTSAAQNLDVTLDADGVFPLATLVGVNSFVDPIL